MQVDDERLTNDTDKRNAAIRSNSSASISLGAKQIDDLR